MGSWDVSPFANDEARGWVHELILNASTEQVFRALVSAAKMRDDEFLQAPECEKAVAAAEIVAAARGKPNPTFPGELKQWLSDRKFVAGDQIAEVAMRVLERIVTNSELKQVWDDTDSATDWIEAVRELQERLKEPHQQLAEGRQEEPETVEDYCEQAAVLVAEGQYTNALATYDAALKLDNASQMVYMGRGVCHLWMGQHDKVIEDINKALTIGRPIPDAYQLRAQAFFHLQKFKNVIADLSTYLRVRPQHMESYFIRGLAYEQMQQVQNAITDFSLLIERNSSDHLVDALKHRAACYELAGRPDLAAWDRDYLARMDHASMYPR